MGSEEITVYVRIVGIYFGSVPGTPPAVNATGDVSVQVGSNPTVKNVMQQVRQEANNGNISGVTGFRMSTRRATIGGTSGEILDRVEVDYNTQPDTRDSYPPGTYSLQNDLHEDPQRVLQYYVYDVSGGPGASNEVTRKNTDNQFIPFNRRPDPDDRIEDGDYVVWRLVTIRTQPDPFIPPIPQLPQVPQIPPEEIPRPGEILEQAGLDPQRLRESEELPDPEEIIDEEAMAEVSEEASEGGQGVFPLSRGVMNADQTPEEDEER